MVAHCGGTHGGDDMVQGIPGSSSSSSASGGHGGNIGLTKQALKKGPWTAAEDAILVEYVKKNGEGNWNAVQKNTSLSRCGKSCRLRWTNHLRPNLKKGSFTPEEEGLILQLHAQLGNKWARMAAQLPGRTDNEIKNYWNTRIKRRIRQGLPLYPNDIGSQKQMQPTSPPMQLENQPVPSPALAIRGRPPLQIPTRTISQFLAQTSHSASPSPSPVSLSPQSYNHLKTSFTHSLSLFDPTSPLSSTSSLASPHSPTILSPTLILNRYHQDPNTSFPGFSISPQTPPLTLPTASSFQFNPLNYNLNSPQGLQTPQSPCMVYTPVKPVELPSNQLYMSQVDKPVPEPEPEPRYENKTEPTMPQSSDAGLIEDLLQQAEALSSNENSQKQNDLFNLQDEKLDFSLKSGYTWDIPHGSDNSSAETGMGIKNEVKQENGSMHEELSQLLQSIPSPSNIPEELNQFRDNLTMPALDFSSGAVASEDSLGLDMQQIASLFQVDSASSDINRQAASCPWDNLPRIC